MNRLACPKQWIAHRFPLRLPLRMLDVTKRFRTVLWLEMLEERVVPNGSPVAYNGSGSELHDIGQFGLLDASDPDEDQLTFIKVANPAFGSVEILDSNMGEYAYTPNPGYVGPDSFTFKVNDGTEDSNTATVSINVTNRNPTAQNQFDSVKHDDSFGANLSGSDADGDSLRYYLVTQPAFGEVDLNEEAGSFTYEPIAGYVGPDSFTFKVNDGVVDSATATFSIDVTNQNPAAQNQSDSVKHGDLFSANLSGSDADGDSLTYLVVSGPTYGEAKLDENIGSFTYTPIAGYVGPDSFTFKVNDGVVDSAPATFSISVTNQVPTAANDTAETDPDTPVDITVMSNDGDGDGDDLSVSAVTQGGYGTVSMVGNDVRYSPNAGFTGSDTFTYTISDGTPQTATATVRVDVANPGGLPVVSIAAIDADAGEPGGANNGMLVLRRTGSTTSPLTVQLGLGIGGQADSSDFEMRVSGAAASQVTFGVGESEKLIELVATDDPDAEGIQAAVIAIQLSPASYALGTANTATIDIHDDENSAPVAAGDNAATLRDKAVTITVLSNDSDPDEDPLAITQATDGKGGSIRFTPDSVSYRPNPGFTGTDTFTYTITDGRGGEASANVTVTVQELGSNGPPDAVDDNRSTVHERNITINVLSNDNDPDSDPLSITAFTQGKSGTVTEVTGALKYTPNTGFTGQDTFTYTIGDGHDHSDSATVTVQVTDAEPVARDDEYKVQSGQTLEVPAPGILPNDYDEDDDPLTAAQVSSPTHGTLVFENTGQFRYTPFQGYTGKDWFDYQAVANDVQSNVARVYLTVKSTNSPPSGQADTYEASWRLPLIVGANEGLLSNDSDPDEDPLFITSNTQPTHGMVAVNPDGGFVYTPAGGYQGTDTFNYDVSDGSTYVTVSVSLSVVNHAPVSGPVGVFKVTMDTPFEGESGALLVNAQGPRI